MVKGLAVAQENEDEKIIQGRNTASQMNVFQCLIPADSSQHEENVTGKVHLLQLPLLFSLE